MANEEKTITEVADPQIPATSHKLPEQSLVSNSYLPRPYDIKEILTQWQPMGIRVTVNLPYISNDQDYLFAIRNTPFIPRWDKQYNGRVPNATPKVEKLREYGHNNMRNVLHCFSQQKAFPADYPVHIIYYDYPPILSTMAHAHRRWRGTMHYRIRTVAGFATQGYVFASALRGTTSLTAVYDEYKYPSVIWQGDQSYREAMTNSYISGDTSMYRHFEIAMPFEYPVQWYDQYHWISKRCQPIRSEEYPDKVQPSQYDPHYDNFIVFGVRGALAGTSQQSQISFELEYRAGEDFQFSDPAFIPHDSYLPISKLKNRTSKIKTKIIPNKDMSSNGLGDHG